MYVGSYGRGTAIDSSDVDILVELPQEEYQRFKKYSGNGQSCLLQDLKKEILKTYPNSDIKADGQVVVINFSDGIVFEVLPAFKNEKSSDYNEVYKYPDTHNGGRWMSTNPKAEIDAIQQKNKNSNDLLKDTCQHIRYMRNELYEKDHLSGILIDSFIYKAIGNWHYTEIRNNCDLCYEKYLLDKYKELSNSKHIRAPGSNMLVDCSKGWNILGKILEFIVRNI